MLQHENIIMEPQGEIRGYFKHSDKYVDNSKGHFKRGRELGMDLYLS
jgi:hypothetical protein